MFKLSCPGKIFLAGEYLALKGEPCLILTVKNCFELIVVRGTGKVIGIPKKSPADLFISKHQEFFNEFDISFVDPYQGQGGYGASSAQFLLSYYLVNEFESMKNGLQHEINIRDLLSMYHNNSWEGRGFCPSGADVVAQYRGGITYWDRNSGTLENLSWPFVDLEFLAFSTGNKIATHEHLQQLADFNAEKFVESILQIKKSFQTKDSQLFVRAINSWAVTLEQNKWVHELTIRQLKDLRADSRVLTAKGCGALGADVILVILNKDGKDQFESEWSKKLNVEMISNLQISKGLQWTIN